MYRIHCPLALAAALLVGLAAPAQESAKDPPTLILQRGKLLFSDDLTRAIGPGWQGTKGRWEIRDGALQGAELKDDMHAAVRRQPIAFTSAVIQYAFKLDGARQTTLSINGVKGHLCRVLIRPTGFTVQKDKADKKGTEKAQVLDTRQVSITPSQWHTLVVELHGKEMLARLDGQHVAYGSHDGIDAKKGNFGFTVAGESVSFKDVRVWDGTPTKDWETTRAKLVAERGR